MQLCWSAPLTEKPQFRRAPAKSSDGRLLAMTGIFLVVGVLLLTRPLWLPPPAPVHVVEVYGMVPDPGLHALEVPTLQAAIEAAGGDGSAYPPTPLERGQAVKVTSDGYHLVPVGKPLLVGLPIDINQAGAQAFVSIPGLSVYQAESIVAYREEHGEFQSLRELEKVRGLGKADVEAMAPFLQLPRQERGQLVLDLNEASPAALDTLPGVGPVMAQKIVEYRERHGGFSRVDELHRVPGIGPKTFKKIQPHVRLSERP